MYFNYSKVAKPGTDLYLAIITNALYLYYSWSERQRYPDRSHLKCKILKYQPKKSWTLKTYYIKSSVDISVKLLSDKAYKYCCGKYHSKTKCYLYEFNILRILWGSLIRCLPSKLLTIDKKTLMLKIVVDPRSLMSK